MFEFECSYKNGASTIDNVMLGARISHVGKASLSLCSTILEVMLQIKGVATLIAKRNADCYKRSKFGTEALFRIGISGLFWLIPPISEAES